MEPLGIAIAEEEVGTKVVSGGIRHPDQRAMSFWMVKPDGSIGQSRVASNLCGNVLQIKNGKMILLADAREKGWRFVRKEYGVDAVRELNEWISKCEAMGKRKATVRVPPPDFYVEANKRTLTEDYEPREGAARALARKRKEEMLTSGADTRALQDAEDKHSAELAKLRAERDALVERAAKANDEREGLAASARPSETPTEETDDFERED